MTPGNLFVTGAETFDHGENFPRRVSYSHLGLN